MQWAEAACLFEWKKRRYFLLCAEWRRMKREDQRRTPSKEIAEGQEREKERKKKRKKEFSFSLLQFGKENNFLMGREASSNLLLEQEKKRDLPVQRVQGELHAQQRETAMFTRGEICLPVQIDANRRYMQKDLYPDLQESFQSLVVRRLTAQPLYTPAVRRDGKCPVGSLD